MAKSIFYCKHLATVILLFVASHNQLFAQTKSVQDVADKFIGLDPNRLSDSSQIKVANEFWNVVKALREHEQKQKQLNGGAGFGFDYNQTRTDNLLNLNAGVQLSRGFYPGQFKFLSKVDLKVQNGKVQENVSDIFMSYDFFPLRDSALWLESFIFTNRFKDEFIGILQRYEIGGGIIFELWSRNNQLKAGKSLQKNIQTTTFNKTFKNTPWSECFDNACGFFKLKGPDDSDIETLQKAQERTHNSLITQYSKVRVGVLLGLYLESEQGKFTDSVQLKDIIGLTNFSRELPNTIKGRFGVRPTIVLKPNERWEVSLKPYFKFPMPWAWNEKVSSKDQAIFSEKFDYYIDFQSYIRVKLDDFQNKKISIALDYRLIYDNAPPRIYLNDQVDVDGNPPLASARNVHHITRLKFEVEF